MTRTLWALVALTAVGLRLWRLAWGLADQGWFPDEVIFSSCAAGFVPLSRASFALQAFSYGTVYGYLAGAATAVVHLGGLIRGTITGTSPEVILIARGVSAAAGIATVWLTGRLAARMYGPRAGLAAAALMAVVPFHVMYGHLASTDVVLTAGVTLALGASHALARRATVPAALAAGIAVGLTTATKYTGLALLAPTGWALAEVAARRRALGRPLLLGTVLLAVAALAFVLACPPCVLHADKVRAALAYERFLATATPGGMNNKLVPSLGWYGRPYLYQLVASLPFALGWPLYALALGGVGLALWRREQADRLLLAFLLPYFYVVGGYRLTFPRYLLPLLPGLVILAARLCSTWSKRHSAGSVVLAAVWVYSLVLAASQVARFSSDQQSEVARWLAAVTPSVPGDARPPGPLRVGAPRALLDYFRIENPLRRAGLVYAPADDGQWLTGAPEAFVLPEWKAIEIRRDRPTSDAARELDRLESGAAGYHEAARWRSWFLQRDLYARLDPAFAGDLWQGEIDFRVYLRAPAHPPGVGP